MGDQTLGTDGSNAERAGLQYPYRSLGSRPIEVVVRDVAALLNYAEKNAPKPPAE